MTSANISDIDIAKPLIKKLITDYDNTFTPTYYMMDDGYDKPDLYCIIHATYHTQVIIPINWRNIKLSTEGINFDG